MQISTIRRILFLGILTAIVSVLPETVEAQQRYLGCYKDSGARDLVHGTPARSDMTVEVCTSTCAQAGYAYAGVQFARHCFCDNSYGTHGTASNCDMACAGNPNQTCGGRWANSIYTTGASGGGTGGGGSTGGGDGTVRPGGGSGSSFDGRTDRPGGDYRNFPIDRADARICRDTCAAEARCKAWTYVNPGVQGSKARCWLKASVPPARRADCCISGVMSGSGGGTNAGGGSSGGGTTGGIRPGWVDPGFPGSGGGSGGGARSGYLGCFKDKAARDLIVAAANSGTMTIGQCVSNCASKNRAFAGVQFGTYCFCDDNYGSYGAADNCNMKCAGNAGETCGGRWANSVYRTGAGGGGIAGGGGGTTGGGGTGTVGGGSSGGGATASTFDGRTNRPGGDYRNFWVDRADARICRDACAAETRCKAWTYVNPGVQGAKARCWLKSSVPPARPDNCCISGVMDSTGGGIAGGGGTGSGSGTGSDGGSSGGGGGSGGGGVSGGGNAAGYLGCFKDRAARDLVVAASNNQTMTIGQCVSTCASRNRAYAGVQFGTYCFCDDDYGSYGAADNCNMSCAGASSETCGGRWANSVYRTGAAGGGSGGSGGGSGGGGGVAGVPGPTPGWIGTDGRQSCISGGFTQSGGLSCVAPAPRPDVGLCADARTLSVIDSWLSRTIPWPGSQLDCWGRWYGTSQDGGAVTRNNCRRPETDGRSRCQYIIDHMQSIQSDQLGRTLMQYIQDNLN